MKRISKIRISNSPLRIKIFSNAGWLLGDKVVRMGVGLFVVAWVARYLGPERFGILSYALALIALLVPIGKLGLDTIVVRDIVRDEGATHEILGTAFTAKLISGIIVAILGVVTISLIKPGDLEMLWLVAILSLMIVFPAMDVVDFWFQSQLRSKNIVIARDAAFLLASIATVGILLAKSSLLAFAGARSLELFLAALGMAWAYKMSGNSIKRWRFDKSRLKMLMADSWPLILAGVVTGIYMRIDQVMIGQMIGNAAVGQYSVAIRIAEVFYFLPVVISKSSFPAIINAKGISSDLYKRRVQKLCSWLAIISYAIALPMTFLSDFVVRVIFGRQYMEAGPVLAIYIWALVFVFLGVAKSTWITSEGLMKYIFISTGMGAVLNILLNIAFIRSWGMLGAAYATLISQSIASVLSNALFRKTRPIFFVQIKSLLLLGFFKKFQQA